MIINDEEYTLVDKDSEDRLVFVIDNMREEHMFSYDEVDEWDE
jgi:hypothetical protein